MAEFSISKWSSNNESVEERYAFSLHRAYGDVIVVHEIERLTMEQKQNIHASLQSHTMNLGMLIFQGVYLLKEIRDE